MGNVALDVARMLLAPNDYLEKYDVPKSVLDLLQESRVRHVSVVGRRGPKEAAFTAKELREMMNLSGVSLSPFTPEAEAAAQCAGAKLSRQQTRLLQLLRGGSAATIDNAPRSWSLDFFRSPTGLERLPYGSPRSLRLSLAHTSVDTETGRAIPTGATSTLDTDLVLYSLGYRSELDGLPWTDRDLGTVRNVGGRVVGRDGRVRRNVYASGWAATGARGVLASTMLDAHALVDTMLSDLRYKDIDGNQEPLETVGVRVVPPPADVLGGDGVPGPAGAEEVLALSEDVDFESIPPVVKEAMNTGQVMCYSDWKRVDAEEVRRGEALGKERERMNWEEACRFIEMA